MALVLHAGVHMALASVLGRPLYLHLAGHRRAWRKTMMG